MFSKDCTLENCIYNLDGMCVNTEDCGGEPIEHSGLKTFQKLDFNIDLNSLSVLDEEDLNFNEEFNDINL